MSPFSTLISCGSSSMRSLRRMRPTRVTRASLRAAQRATPSPSASLRIVRSLSTLNDAAAPADALLREKHREAALDHDGKRRQHDHRQAENQQHRRRRDVEQALDDPAHRTLVEALAVDQPACLQRVDRHLTSHAFVERRQVADRNAATRHSSKSFIGNDATALLARRDDDFVDAKPLHDACSLRSGGNVGARPWPASSLRSACTPVG